MLTGRVRDLCGAARSTSTTPSAPSRYRLRQSHVGLVVWVDDGSTDALTRLRRFTTDLGRALDCDEQGLFVAYDERSAWVWLPTKIDVARSPELIEVAKADDRVRRGR